VRDGRIPMSVLDEAVRRVLRLKFQAGLFDHPYVDASRESGSLMTDANRREARRGDRPAGRRARRSAGHLVDR
jgi:beta-glucosidase